VCVGGGCVAYTVTVSAVLTSPTQANTGQRKSCTGTCVFCQINAGRMYVCTYACMYICMYVYGKEETEDLQFEASVFCDKALLILTPVYSFFQRI
jgi:hypothetical protein